MRATAQSRTNSATERRCVITGGNYVRRLLVMLKLVKMTRVIGVGSDRGRTARQRVRKIFKPCAVEEALSPAGRVWACG